MKKRLIAMFLALSVVLTGCGGGEEAAKDKDTLTIAQASDAESMDPIVQNSIYAENIIKQIYDTLLVRTPEGDIENRLAESVEQPDDVSYVIKIRPNVKFSNGEDLTSEDVAYTLNRAATSNEYGYIYGQIDPNSYDTSDPNVLKFRLKKPDATFKAALAHPAASIVDKETTEADPEGLGTKPVGTGPFKLDSWKKLDNTSLSYNENYWGDKPAFDKMVFRIIPEDSNRMIELDSGEADIAMEVAPNDASKVEENENLALYTKLDNSVHFMGLTVDRGIFENPKAREAMDYALDMQAIVDAVYMGHGKIATGPINPNIPYSISDSIEPHKRDIEKAKALLAEAGVKEGETVQLYCHDQQSRIDMATIIQSQLKEVGLNVEISPMEWNTYMSTLGKPDHKHDMFLMSWSPSVVDPHYPLYATYHSDKKGTGPNFMFYGNPELDALIEQGLRAPEDERAAIYKQAQELVINDHPVVFALYGEQIIGAQKFIKNFDPDPSGSNEFYHITFE
ncbi:MAG: ABC transporter substrate-binding protein [Peptoniphilus sp.]|nr:ABC transporter substrate-binding protein [Peptoniphilus sp.]MDD7363781.1 ABC transporter substrate-binding protein [Bacillota bacterium]MDY6044622.1 ABC transporter substrate-binding protein [Peptoniphilus sp.]